MGDCPEHGTITNTTIFIPNGLGAFQDSVYKYTFTGSNYIFQY